MASKVPPVDANAEIDAVLLLFGGSSFSSHQFIEVFQEEYPKKWKEIVDRYGAGGKGSGNRFSSSGFIGRQLDFRAYNNALRKLPRRRAPAGWGNSWILVWRSFDHEDADNDVYPDESTFGGNFWEGGKEKVFVNRYERDEKARAKCVAHYKCICAVCKLDFGKRYGPHGKDFIHVHHLKPLYKIAERYKVDPIEDLRPVCPNCHAMIHYRGGLLSVEEVRAILRPAPRKISD